MKTRYDINILFYFNLVIIAILSIGAAYFMLIGIILFGTSVERAISAATQNFVMVGMWLIYFTSIAFFPILRRYRGKKIKIIYVSLAIPIIIFIVSSFGLLPHCWEFELARFFGMTHSDIGCL